MQVWQWLFFLPRNPVQAEPKAAMRSSITRLASQVLLLQRGEQATAGLAKRLSRLDLQQQALHTATGVVGYAVSQVSLDL
jgi:hypothetical protein